MQKLAIITSKLTKKIGESIGRGSSFPGKLALAIKPDLLSSLEIPQGLSFITGTNGKTSTAHFVASILEASGEKVVHNIQGANLPQGILSTLLDQANLSGKIDADQVVLEVDEGFLGVLSKALKPKYLLITNLFEDQVDRFGSVKHLANQLTKQIPEETKLILNANDPHLIYLASKIKNKSIKYYGTYLGDKDKADELACPSCGASLKYESHIYDSLGIFSCNCGLKTPDLDYELENIDLKLKQFRINGKSFHSQYDSDYMIFNLLGAISLAEEMGISYQAIQKGIESYQVGRGRMESLEFNGQPTFFNLVKNKSALDRSIDYIKSQEDSIFDLVLAINNQPADGRDYSWVNKSNLSTLKEANIDQIFMLGQVAKFVKDFFVNAGFEEDRIHIFDNVHEAIAKVKGDKKVYFLSNYTAMDSLLKALDQWKLKESK